MFKPERVERLLVSAAKQSHKGAIPQLEAACTVGEFLRRDREGLKIICYCDEIAGKVDIKEALGSDRESEKSEAKPKITILIGPEGDFSRAEVALALERGWRPVSLGDSRLRIETAALVATTAVYLRYSAG